MNDLVLPPAYQSLLKQACERAYRKGIRRGKRHGHATGHAAGRDELLSGLKALAKLNGSAEPITRITKSFDESKHPRNEQGEFTKGEEIAAAAADPAKRKELEANMDPENKAKLAAAIEEHKGGAGDTGVTSASSAHQGAVALDKLAKAFKAKDSGAAGWQKEYTDAIDHATNEIGKLTRDELGKLKEALSVKAGGKKAEIARAIATKAIAAGHAGAAKELLAPKESAKPADTPPPEPPPEPPAAAPEPEIPAGVKKVIDFWQKVADSPGSPKKIRNAQRMVNALRKAAGLPPKSKAKPVSARPETRAVMGHGEGRPAPATDLRTNAALDEAFATAPEPTRPPPANMRENAALDEAMGSVPSKPPETPEDKYTRSPLKAFADGKPMSPLAVHDETAKALRGEYGPDIQDAVTSITAHPEQYNTLKKKQDAIRRTLADTRMSAPPATEPAAKAPHETTRHEYVAAARAKAEAEKPGDALHGRNAEINATAEHAAAVSAAATAGTLPEHVLNSLPMQEQGIVAGGMQAAQNRPHAVTGGNTYQHRQLLASIGGKWDMKRRRWVVPAAALAKLPPGLRGEPV